MLPLREENGRILVAVADPESCEVFHDLQVLLGRPVSPCLAASDQILSAINRVYEMGSDRAEVLMEELTEVGLDALAHELEEPKDLLDADDEAPVIRLVNGILFQAVKDRASDVHI